MAIHVPTIATAKPSLLRRVRRIVRTMGLGLGGVLLGAVLLSVLSNMGLPTQSQMVERLHPLEKARLAEAAHLQQTLGDAAWPGWGALTIPLLVYNEEYAFLTGYKNPPVGWQTVPGGELQGGAWERVPSDDFNGAPYYRQRVAEGVTPQAFTVRVGEQSVASLTTMEWMKISLREEIRQQVPDFLAPIVPYSLIDRMFVGSSDWYIAALLHESFHSFQDTVAPTYLAMAEQAAWQYEGQYPWKDTAVVDAWQAELELLAEAVRAPASDALHYAQRFLALRDARRTANNLSSELARYEQQREWVEGLAKYGELAIWRQAATAEGYEPLGAIIDDPWFQRYRDTFEQRWSQEVDQIRRMARDEGDGRFYYSGWAQAVLLDRLLPEWKDETLHGALSLETLLHSAVE